MEATCMDKKQLVKTLINVVPIIIVPLILERKRIKSHPDVKKASEATAKASKNVATKSIQFKDVVVDKSGNAKDYVVTKKHNMDEKRQLRQIAKEHDPAYIQKQEAKAVKSDYKEAEKLDKILQKQIDKRHKEEAKAREDNKKERIKNMKKSNKHMEKVGLTPGKLDDKTEKKGEKLAKDNSKDISKLDKRLQKNIDKRHKAEAKALDNNKKDRLAELEKYKNYDAKSVIKQRNDSEKQ